jgi:hypothetical protein
VLVLAMSGRADAAAVFSTFGPGDSYGPGGYMVYSVLPGFFNVDQDMGDRFTFGGAQSYTLDSIEMALNYAQLPGTGPTNVVDVSLMTDVLRVSGLDLLHQPGDVIETFALNVSGGTRIVTGDSVLHPVLNPDTNYWLCVSIAHGEFRERHTQFGTPKAGRYGVRAIPILLPRRNQSFSEANRGLCRFMPPVLPSNVERNRNNTSRRTGGAKMKRHPGSRWSPSRRLCLLCCLAVSFAGGFGVRSVQAGATSLSGAPDRVPLLRGVVQSGGTSDIQPLAGAQVTLLEATEGCSKVIGRAVTDKAGRFIIDGCGGSSTSVFYVTAELSEGRVLAAVLGPTLPPQVTINELTTVAFTYSMAQFLKNGALEGDDFGLRIAAGMNNNLVAVGTGEPSPVLLASPNADETNALRSTRALANLISPCIRNKPAGCDTLFELATPPGGTRPTDTVQALLDIARHPAHNVERTYRQSKVLELYTPALEHPPDAWTLAVKVNDSGDDAFPFGGPGNLVFDKRGYAWITNNTIQGTTVSTDHSIVLKPDGTPSDGQDGTPLSPITGGGLLGPGFGICTDTQGLIWIGNFGWGGVNPTPSGSVSKFALSGQPLSPASGFQQGVFRVQQVVSDRANNIWMASFGNNRVVVYPQGNADQPIFFQGLPVFLPFGAALAHDGTVWVTNSDPEIGSLSRFQLAQGALVKRFEVFFGRNLKGVVVDSRRNVWAASGGDDTVYAFADDGKYLGAFSGGGMNGPWGLAVDGDDNIWVGDFGPLQVGNIFSGRLTELAGANPVTRPVGLKPGDPISPATGYTLPSAGSQVLLHNGTPLYGPGAPPSFIPMMRTTGVAIDRAGNIWTANNWKSNFDVDVASNPGGDGMVIFVGLAKPPRQP